MPKKPVILRVDNLASPVAQVLNNVAKSTNYQDIRLFTLSYAISFTMSVLYSVPLPKSLFFFNPDKTAPIDCFDRCLYPMFIIS